MRELKRLAILSMEPDPEQPRKEFDESELLLLAESMKRHGQQVPVICYEQETLGTEGSK